MFSQPEFFLMQFLLPQTLSLCLPINFSLRAMKFNVWIIIKNLFRLAMTKSCKDLKCIEQIKFSGKFERNRFRVQFFFFLPWQYFCECVFVNECKFLFNFYESRRRNCANYSEREGFFSLKIAINPVKFCTSDVK